MKDEEALAIVQEAAGSGTRTTGVARLLYPYYWSIVHPSNSTWERPLSRSRARVSCLVDARNAVPASTDPFTPLRLSLAEDEALEPRVESTRCQAVALRYARYVLSRRRRALVRTPLVATTPRLVFKPFWIVDCDRDRGIDRHRHAHGDGDAFSLLVDSITGRFHVLEAAPS
jgi:hypothetical protein